MADTTIKKVEADFSPKGEIGQRYLVAGKRVSMRLWIDQPGGKLKAQRRENRGRGLRSLGQRHARFGRTNSKP